PTLSEKIEKYIVRECLDFMPQQIDSVKDREMLCRMAARPKRSHDIRLGFPILRFHLIAEVLIDGGGTCAVEKHQDFEFLFHVIFVRFVIPSVVEESLISL